MKQKYIMAFFLSAILVLILSGTDSVFADYNEEYENHDKECKKDDSEDDDRYKKRSYIHSYFFILHNFHH